jgi:hypothetical protein
MELKFSSDRPANPIYSSIDLNGFTRLEGLWPKRNAENWPKPMVESSQTQCPWGGKHLIASSWCGGSHETDGLLGVERRPSQN